MNFKVYYIVENSVKDLIRKNGIIFSTIGIFLVSFITFFLIDTSTFLFHWENYVKTEIGNTGVGIQGLSPILMALSLFKYLTSLISLALTISTVGYIRRSFTQYANLEKKDFLTMSFVGETTFFISFGIALQALYYSFFILLINALLAKRIFLNLLNTTSDLNYFKVIIADFNDSNVYSISIILFSAIYVFIRTFIYTRKYLVSFFDNRLVDIN